MRKVYLTNLPTQKLADKLGIRLAFGDLVILLDFTRLSATLEA